MKPQPTIAELEAILNEPNPKRVWIKPDGTVTDHDPDWSTDPVKKEIFDAIGDLSKLDRLFSARVLVATYIPPRKSKGGIIFTDKELQESVYQAAVGLVIAKGPRVFKDDASNEFHGQDVAIGEWVAFRPGDSKRVQVNGVNCRLVDDTQIDMVVTEPDWVTHRQVDARVK